MQNVFETVNLAYPSKTKDSITSKKLHSRDFWQIANGVLTRSKSAIPPLINGPEGLASAYGKAKLLARNFFKNSNLEDSGFSLPVSPSTTNLKCIVIVKLPSLVKKVITNLDSAMTSCIDYMPVVVLK